jgi:phosphohistidine phosphatase SixA
VLLNQFCKDCESCKSCHLGKLKKLIVVRHGDYSCRKNGVTLLTEAGKASMELLAKKLIPHMQGEVIVRSSPAVRALQSVAIISKESGFGYDICEGLWYADEHRYPEDPDKVLKLILSLADTTDVIVLMTHRDYTSLLPAYFSALFLNTRLESSPIDYARAAIIDCENATLSLI